MTLAVLSVERIRQNIVYFLPIRGVSLQDNPMQIRNLKYTHTCHMMCITCHGWRVRIVIKPQSDISQ